MLNSFIRFFLENKLVAYLLLLLFVGWGLVTALFDFGIETLPRDPVAVDAIPDIGENQQSVFFQTNQGLTVRTVMAVQTLKTTST